MVACRQWTLAVGGDGRPLVLRKDRLIDRATGEERPVVCAEWADGVPATPSGHGRGP